MKINGRHVLQSTLYMRVAAGDPIRATRGYRTAKPWDFHPLIGCTSPWGRFTQHSREGAQSSPLQSFPSIPFACASSRSLAYARTPQQLKTAEDNHLSSHSGSISHSLSSCGIRRSSRGSSGCGTSSMTLKISHSSSISSFSFTLTTNSGCIS